VQAGRGLFDGLDVDGTTEGLCSWDELAVTLNLIVREEAAIGKTRAAVLQLQDAVDLWGESLADCVHQFGKSRIIRRFGGAGACGANRA
jgi:hypothetical protein